MGNTKTALTSLKRTFSMDIMSTLDPNGKTITIDNGAIEPLAEITLHGHTRAIHNRHKIKLGEAIALAVARAMVADGWEEKHE